MDIKITLTKSLFPLYSLLQNLICKIRYHRIIKRLRHKLKEKEKINVLFFVNEISKWKAQALYDLLLKDTHFKPTIGLTFSDVDWELTSEERRKKRNTLIELFSSREMPIIECCIENSDGSFKFIDFEADIVFYQQPWKINKKQSPEYISKRALTCYLPYYVPNYCILKTSCHPEFHFKLWRYYHLSQPWVDNLNKNFPRLMRAVKIVATGHPMLDAINNSKVKSISPKMIIYAPHWSVYSDFLDNDEHYSTFQFNGKQILDFAKSHPEYKWCFKPHPSLKVSLLRTRLWSEQEIENYYAEWEQIGEVCQTGDYTELFWRSSLMITDCASFLVEYPCTKNPLIHLVSSSCKVPIPEPSRKLFESFYEVHNYEEMIHTFNMIIVECEDPKRTERLKAVEKAGLFETKASEKILKDIYKALNIV